MITLRRRPHSADRTLPRLTAAAWALLLSCATVLGGSRNALASHLPAAAVSPSHTHHPLATPLPTSSLVETSAGHGAKKRKGSTHADASASRQGAAARSRKAMRGSEAGAVSATHGATTRNQRAGKGRRGRPPAAEPSDDFIPMSRAELRKARRAGAGKRELAKMSRPGVGRRNRRGNYTTSFLAMRAEAPPIEWRSRSRAGAQPAARAATRSSDLAEYKPGGNPSFFTKSSQKQGSVAGAMGDESGAQGTAYPDEDERLPRHAQGGGATKIGTAELLVSPLTRPAPTAVGPTAAPLANGQGAPPQVVQGFGGEVALMPSDPGATRRRNHPLAASALPGLAPPPTLEEREAITEAAVSPAVLPEIYDRDGRLLMPAPLRGSREVLVHQNTMANSDGLERILDDSELDRLRANRELVGFPSTESLRVNDALPYNRRYARPWTVMFAGDIAHDFFNRFHEPIYVTSAVRTVHYQARLQRVNGNAAATAGDAASPHLTGQAIDLAKRGMSGAELAWMRAYLLPLMGAGKIDVEEEFQQACFHISVYRRYAAGRRPLQVAQVGTVTHSPDARDDSSLPQN